MSGNLNRRQVLAWGGGTALALVFGNGAWAQSAVSVDDFIALSARLVERQPRALASLYATPYLDAIVAKDRAGLAALINGTSDAALEAEIIANWYTGLHDTADGEAIVTYEDALIWEALDYTKPMGWCGGETGYWADAPAGEA
jgi:hypothetical protein